MILAWLIVAVVLLACTAMIYREGYLQGKLDAYSEVEDTERRIENDHTDD